MVEEWLLKGAILAVVTGIIGAIFSLFTRLRLVESTVRVIQAEVVNDREARKELGHKMETLGGNMVDLGREMSDVAAVIRTALIQQSHK